MNTDKNANHVLTWQHGGEQEKETAQWWVGIVYQVYLCTYEFQLQINFKEKLQNKYVIKEEHL